MARYLLAALCAVLVAAEAATKIDYASPERVISSIPNSVMPALGKSWDSIADEHATTWLKDHVAGKIIADVTDKARIEPYHPRKDSANQDDRFETEYSYRVVVKQREFSIGVTAYFAPDQEKAIEKLRDGDKVKIIGKIASAEIKSAAGQPNLIITIHGAHVQRQ